MSSAAGAQEGTMSESKSMTKNSLGEDQGRERVCLPQAAASIKARGDKRFPSEP